MARPRLNEDQTVWLESRGYTFPESKTTAKLNRVLDRASRGPLSIDPQTDMPRTAEGGFVTSGRGLSAAKREALELRRAAKAAAIRHKTERIEDLTRALDGFDADIRGRAGELRGVAQEIRGLEVPSIHARLSPEAAKRKAAKARDKRRALKARIEELEGASAPGTFSLEGEQVAGQGVVDAVPSGGLLPAALLNPALLQSVGRVALPLAKSIFGAIVRKIKGKREAKAQGASILPFRAHAKIRSDVDLWRRAFGHARKSLKALKAREGGGLSAEEFDAQVDRHIKALKRSILGEVRGSSGRQLGGVISVADILRPVALGAVVRGRYAHPKEVRRIIDHLEDEPALAGPAEALLGGSLKSFFKKAVQVVRQVGDSKVGQLLKEKVLPVVKGLAADTLAGIAETDTGTKGQLAGLAASLLSRAPAPPGLSVSSEKS